VEASPHLHRTLTRIRELGCRAGVALNPVTPLWAIEEALAYADFVLLMSVNPGWGGQRFIPASLDRARRLRAMIRERGLPTRIEMDGGIGVENLMDVLEGGVEMVVAGSAIFAAPDPAQVVAEMVELARRFERRTTC